MKIDDILLMAYVDDELPPHDCRQVEDEIAAWPDVAERIALFTASRLPYREAFAQQKLPPVPECLTKKIEQMARAQAPSLADTSANDASMNHDGQVLPSAFMRSRLRIAPAWLAVAFVGGIFSYVAVQRFAPDIVPGLNPMRATIASVAPGASPWIQAAVDYQQLYARETIDQLPVDDSTSAKTVEAIRREDGLALRVPDLREAGLTFKRVQRLRFHDRPLIQIVYLPRKGAPVALCVIKDPKSDQDVTSQRVGDMNVVTWRRAELGYALIGNSDDVDLAALSKQISNRSVDQLFGGLDATLQATPFG
jgi:anti-sigma factor RsiW